MKPLNNIYKESFFGKRYKLHWRAPIFCRAVNKELNFKSVIDVGCADGDLVKQWISDGCDAYGLEGAENAKKFSVIPFNRQIWHDLREPIVATYIAFDLVVSLEVAEHIEPEYADIYVRNLILLHNSRRAGILISAAPPGQGGHYHVNCQPAKYWEFLFGEYKYFRNKVVEEKIKKRIYPWRNKPGIKAFYKNLLFLEDRR